MNLHICEADFIDQYGVETRKKSARTIIHQDHQIVQIRCVKLKIVVAAVVMLEVAVKLVVSIGSAYQASERD